VTALAVVAWLELADRIDAALPQTQCTRCGEPDCRRYAEAIARGEAPINRCPPGGQTGVERLAAITGQAVLPLDPVHGVEAERGVARIDEAWCIGCTLCIKACPVDAIIGTAKHMHTVIESDCTGCELCIPVCPVDCIELPVVTPDRTGWAAWGSEEARLAQARYAARSQRLQREASELQARLAVKAEGKLLDVMLEVESDEKTRKRAVIEAALQRARAKVGR
jgi:Na+-translocating ferredoxin:NAD+ oxidoreductase subunit B